MHKMVSTQGASGFSVEHKQYVNDDNDMVDVEDHHVDAAQVHGYRFATLDEEAKFQQVSRLTPLVVASMTRDQMKAFIESRGLDTPEKTAAMRELVQKMADEEQDKAAEEQLKEGENEGEEDGEGDGEEDGETGAKRPRLKSRRSRP